MRILLLLIAAFIGSAGLVWASEADSSDIQLRSHWRRNLIVGNLATGTAAYFYLANTWGTPNGRFHIKQDIDDNLNLTDEISHVFVGYKLTAGFGWLFRLLRLPSDQIERYAVFQAALITTLVEFPLDAYNPTQGLGVSDLVANYSGIGFAVLQRRHPDDFDLKVSVKRSPLEFENKFLASKNEEFDNFIWWASYKPKYLWTGIGYSTNHFHGNVESEYYLGVGTTLFDLLGLIDKNIANEFKALDSYFIVIKKEL